MSWNVIDKYNFDPSGETDNAPLLARLCNDLMALAINRKPIPRVVWPEGLYAYSKAPNFAINNLEMCAEGQVELCYTGSDDALTFYGADGTPTGGGKVNIMFDGFRIVPTLKARNCLVLNSIHHSHFRVRVYGAGAARGPNMGIAVRLDYCVCTNFPDLSVSPFDTAFGGVAPGGTLNCYGVWIDKVTQPQNWQTTDCTFERPIIENITTGVYIADGGFNDFKNGTIENCGTGVIVSVGGNNRFRLIDMEGNKLNDIVFQGGAHENLVWLSGTAGSVKVSDKGSSNVVMRHEGWAGMLGR